MPVDPHFCALMGTFIWLSKNVLKCSILASLEFGQNYIASFPVLLHRRARGGWPSGLERKRVDWRGMVRASSNPGEGNLMCGFLSVISLDLKML